MLGWIISGGGLAACVAAIFRSTKKDIRSHVTSGGDSLFLMCVQNKSRSEVVIVILTYRGYNFTEH